MTTLTDEEQQRLTTEQNIWLATVRPNGRPHLVPIWFAWYNEKFYVCTPLNTVKGRNVQQNPHVTCSLEDGLHPIIAQGTAQCLPQPWPTEVVAIFKQKYDWDINTQSNYNGLIEITPQKWLRWSTDAEGH